MDKDFNLGAFISDMAESHARLVRVGITSTEDRFRPALRALEREFQAAILDPETKIKSSFQAAVLNVLSLMPAERAVNDYAETMIRMDQRERHEGRADQDQDTRGNRLKAGS